jgi:hypothetical protein
MAKKYSDLTTEEVSKIKDLCTESKDSLLLRYIMERYNLSLEDTVKVVKTYGDPILFPRKK